MKYLIGLVLGLAVGLSVPSLAAKFHTHNVVEVQYTETGAAYKHGDHCIDGRVF